MYISDLFTVAGYLHTDGLKTGRINFAKCRSHVAQQDSTTVATASLSEGSAATALGVSSC